MFITRNNSNKFCKFPEYLKIRNFGPEITFRVSTLLYQQEFGLHNHIVCIFSLYNYR